MVCQTNPTGIKLYFYANTFFCFSNPIWLLVTWVKTLSTDNQCRKVFPKRCRSNIICSKLKITLTLYPYCWKTGCKCSDLAVLAGQLCWMSKLGVHVTNRISALTIYIEKFLHSGARSSKVPKLFVPFSGVTIPSLSQEQRGFKSSNVTVILLFVNLKTC